MYVFCWYFFFLFVLVDRQKKKSRKWSLGQGENVKDPAHPHFPNQSPPPTHTPHRVKTAMQAPLVQMGRKRKQTKAKVLFSTPYGERKKESGLRT